MQFYICNTTPSNIFRSVTDKLQGGTTTYLRAFDDDYIFTPTIVLDIARCACKLLTCMFNVHRFRNLEFSGIAKLFGH